MPSKDVFNGLCRLIYESAKRRRPSLRSRMSPESCISQSIQWMITEAEQYLLYLAEDFLREGYLLPLYSNLVVDTIMKNTKGCDPLMILALITKSQPTDRILEQLNERWSEIRIGSIELIQSQISRPDEEAGRRIQAMYKFWWQSLKALSADKDRRASQFHTILKETVLFLRGVIDRGSPPVFLIDFIKLLQKVVEIVFYNSWKFVPKPRRTGVADDYLYRSVASLVKDSDSLHYNEDKFTRLLMYTRARALYALCNDDRSLANSVSHCPQYIMSYFVDHGSLFFRLLYTLLMTESKLIEIGAQEVNHFPSANDLFAALLEVYKSRKQTLIETIVSPDTDGLTYITHYAHRLSIINNVEFELGYPLLPSEEWKNEYADDAKRLLSGVIQRLNEMYPIGEKAQSAQLLIVTIGRAIDTLQ